jgi:hypothetical protein
VTSLSVSLQLAYNGDIPVITHAAVMDKRVGGRGGYTYSHRDWVVVRLLQGRNAWTGHLLRLKLLVYIGQNSAEKEYSSAAIGGMLERRFVRVGLNRGLKSMA